MQTFGIDEENRKKIKKKEIKGRTEQQPQKKST